MIYNIGDKIGGIKLATTLECKIADAARAEGSAETTDSMGREAQRCFDKGYRAGEDAALGEVDRLAGLLHESIDLLGKWDRVPMGAIPPHGLTYGSAKFALRAALALDAANPTNPEKKETGQ